MARKISSKQAEQQVHHVMTEASAGRDEWVPLSLLWLSEKNVRTKRDPASIRSLAAQIEAEGGLLNPLAVIVEVKDGQDGYGVVAGGRRLLALLLLVEQGKMDADALAPVKIFENEQAVSVSLSENITQEPMNPADELVAFRSLAAEGKSIEQIAARYSVKELTVRRRLALANLAPEFVDLYRDGKVSVDVLQALALTDEHERQRQAWAALPSHSRSAYHVRNLLSEDDVSAAAPLARFVGLKAYKKAGGGVRQDLFATGPGDGVYLTDKVLLHKLRDERMAEEARKLVDSGWKWAEHCEGFSAYGTHKDLLRMEPAMLEATDAQAEALAAIEARRAAIDQRLGELEEPAEHDEAAAAEVDRLYEEQDELAQREGEIDDERTGWNDGHKAVGGVVMVISHEGKLVLHAGYARRADVAEQSPEARREAGVPAKAERAEFSKGLMASLTAHRSAAVAASLAANPQIALAALVHSLVMDQGEPWQSSPLKVRFTDASHEIRRNAAGYEQSKASAAMDEAEASTEAVRSGASAEVFARFLALDEAQLLKILAQFVARTYTVISQDERKERGFDAAAAIESALGLDMADWWEATDDTYLGSVSKAKMIEAITEAGMDAADLASMKKADAITTAQQRLAGRRWLPAPLRPYTVDATAEAADD